MTENKGDVTLIVNSREREISSKVLSSDGEITFDQVVKLAFADPPSGPIHRVHAVSYLERRRSGQQKESSTQEKV